MTQKNLLNLLFFISISYHCYSQSYFNQLDSTNYFLTNFENNINNADLKDILRIDKHYGKFYVNLQGLYSSDVSKLNENFVRDMSDVSLITNYSYNKKLGLGFGFQQRNLSDNRSTELNKNKFDFFFTNFDYQPFSELYLNSKIGFKTDEQIGEVSNGFSGNLLADLRNLNFQDYTSDGKINLMYEDLNPKINQNYEIAASISKKFTENSQNYADIRAFSNKYEFFIPATQSIINRYNIVNNVQSRTENYVNLDDKLEYSFTKLLKATINGTFRTRNVYLEYRYKSNSGTILFENYLIANGKLDFNYKNLYAFASLSYSERSEVHNLINSDDLNETQISQIEKTEKDKDNNSRFTLLNIEADYRLSNTNLIRFINTSSILRYDTDSKDNFDDRDEAAFIYSISHKYDNLKNFSIETFFDVNIFKTQYIFKEKSSNNNTNRIYKMTSRSYFAPLPNIITKNQFQVLANYTVYDFEDILSQVQSFSFRQLSLRDSILYEVNSRLNLEFINDLKFYEQGEFRESEFSERPLMYYDERKMSSQISYLFYDFLNISFGYKYFIQKQFEFDNGEKVLKRTITSYGPYTKASIYLSSKSNINIIASRDITSSNLSSFSNSSDNLIIYIIWYL